MTWLKALDFLRRRWPAILLAVAGLALILVAANGLARWKADSAAREAVRARAGAEVSKAGDKASGAALEATAAMGERELGRAAVELENRDEILSAPNAGADAGAAGDAGLAGLCRRAAYRNHPRCAGLRRADTAPAPR